LKFADAMRIYLCARPEFSIDQQNVSRKYFILLPCSEKKQWKFDKLYKDLQNTHCLIMAA
jgi:hypothetical protein